jgi:hypothetical protein
LLKFLEPPTWPVGFSSRRSAGHLRVSSVNEAAWGLLLKVKNWSEFQHYKDRCPPWIKLHHSLLDNLEFHNLSPLAVKALVLLWLLASESATGDIDANPSKLAFRLRMSGDDVNRVVEELLESRFLADGEELPEVIAPEAAVADEWGSRHISDRVRRAVWLRDGGKCRACTSEENIEYDHIIPVSKGGNSGEGNIQLLCRKCNRKKRTKTAYHPATTAQPLATPSQVGLNRCTTEAEAYKQETEGERKILKGKAPTPHSQPDWVDERDSRELAKAKKTILSRLQASVGSGQQITETEFMTAVCEESGLLPQRVKELEQKTRWVATA